MKTKELTQDAREEILAAVHDADLCCPEHANSEAWQTGYEACLQGDTECPYLAGTWDEEQWHLGFTARE